MIAQPVKIAFQGALGAFSHQAAKKFTAALGQQSEFVPCQTFGEVFQNVVSGGTEYGAIPLENSSIGSILANYDLLWTHDAIIISEYFLPVHHALIGHPDAELKEITAVYSHPAALDQCRGLFQNHPQMAARVHWDTSGAVVFVRDSRDRSIAAIAGEASATEHGMHVLMSNIEDFTHNATRFGLITKAGSSQAKVTAPYKVSIAAELQHKPGSLSDLLNRFAKIGANLTKIESRPIGESPWHYRFFLDMEVADDGMESRIKQELEAVSGNYKILGEYNLIT